MHPPLHQGGDYRQTKPLMFDFPTYSTSYQFYNYVFSASSRFYDGVCVEVAMMLFCNCPNYCTKHTSTSQGLSCQLRNTNSLQMKFSCASCGGRSGIAVNTCAAEFGLLSGLQMCSRAHVPMACRAGAASHRTYKGGTDAKHLGSLSLLHSITCKVGCFGCFCYILLS